MLLPKAAQPFARWGSELARSQLQSRLLGQGQERQRVQRLVAPQVLRVQERAPVRPQRAGEQQEQRERLQALVPEPQRARPVVGQRPAQVQLKPRELQQVRLWA